MRHVVNIVAAVFVLVIVGFVSAFAFDRYDTWNRTRDTRASLVKLRQELGRIAGMPRDGAMAIKLERTDRGFPLTVKPEWFSGGPPRNALLPGERPWIEVAGESQALFEHPIARCDTSGSLAEFWYNPYLGIIRARVPYAVNDRTTLDRYNAVNDSRVATLYELPRDPVASASPD